MLAFDVYLNEKKLCRAGVGDDGVLTAIVTYVKVKGRRELYLHVGGIMSSDHVLWAGQKPLRVGDRMLVRIVETKLADKPTKRYRIRPADELKAKKLSVRRMAKELGWKIQSRPK